MRTVAIIIYEDAVLSSLSSVIDLLNAANVLADEENRERPFRIELIGENFKNIQLLPQAQIICSRTMKDSIKADLIIVPPFNGKPDEILKKHEGVTSWIVKQASSKVEWASLCLGAYLLAEAQLLKNRKATSHWKAVNDLRFRYPDVTFVADQIITDHDGIYTSGGAFSSLNLIIYLLEKFCGKEVAVTISKEFSIEMDRVSQSHFSIFNGQRSHQDKQIHQAQDYIESNFLKAISIDSIAESCNMSRRNFVRRFVSATGVTPLEYTQGLKIEVAKKALETTRDPIADIMHRTGYNDINSFREVFRKMTGITPQAYQKKYSRRI